MNDNDTEPSHEGHVHLDDHYYITRVVVRKTSIVARPRSSPRGR